MTVAQSFTIAKLCAIHNGGVILFVENYHIITTDNGADGTQVGLHSGRKDQRSFFTDPFCQFPFKLFVQFNRSIQETRASAGGTKALNGIQRSLADFGMGG